MGRWPGTFDHDLHPGPARALDQFAQRQQFLQLGPVAAVGQRPRPQPVAQRQGDVELAGNGQQLVEVFEKRIFLVVVQHPGGQQRTAAGNDAGDARLFSQLFDGFQGQAGMDGHEVDPVLGLAADVVEHLRGASGRRKVVPWRGASTIIS